MIGDDPDKDKKTTIKIHIYKKLTKNQNRKVNFKAK
jgi:hypothetical protein